VSTQVPLCEIGNDGQYLNGFYLQGSGSNPPAYATTGDLNPYEISLSTTNFTTFSTQTSSWISPHLPLMSLAFDRYRVASLEFVYEPQSTAVISDRLVFAWTDDPSHPFLSAEGQNVTATTASQLQALVTTDSVAFMPWKSWTLKVPVSSEPRFMYAPETTSDLNRFYSFGSMTCVASTSSVTPVAAIYGILYVRLVIDLFDPVPIVSSVSTLVESLHAARRQHARVTKCRPHLSASTLNGHESKEEKKLPSTPSVTTEWDMADPSPPRFERLRTSAPGGSLYTTELPTPTPVKRPSQK
jgi:hypothetical protein